MTSNTYFRFQNQNSDPTLQALNPNLRFGDLFETHEENATDSKDLRQGIKQIDPPACVDAAGGQGAKWYVGVEALGEEALGEASELLGVRSCVLCSSGLTPYMPACLPACLPVRCCLMSASLPACPPLSLCGCVCLLLDSLTRQGGWKRHITHGRPLPNATQQAGHHAGRQHKLRP